MKNYTAHALSTEISLDLCTIFANLAKKCTKASKENFCRLCSNAGLFNLICILTYLYIMWTTTVALMRSSCGLELNCTQLGGPKHS